LKILSLLKNINKLAIPATIAGIAEPLLSLTIPRLLVISKLMGYRNLLLLQVLLGSFLSMLIWVLGKRGVLISTIISQYLGAGNIDEVKSLPAQAIFLNISLSMFFIIHHIYRRGYFSTFKCFR